MIKAVLFVSKTCSQCGEVKAICEKRDDVIVADGGEVYDAKEHELKPLLTFVFGAPTLVLLDEHGNPCGAANTPQGIKTELSRIQ